ncbi:Sulfotransferase domain [Dillenia turbinata]|uniref:Sulfotransferase n=1 Tax=Dillenia turbinata TaxID=194707 RepID=A0AAN8ZEE0_9MAGN
MDNTSNLQTQVSVKEDKYVEVESEELNQLVKSLPKQKGWRSRHLYLYQDFWVASSVFSAVISFQQHFQAQNTDIIITGLPKSGNTWLKALIYSIVNRKKFSIDKSPLNTAKSHDLVQSLEDTLYFDNKNPNLSTIEPPRMFSTHLPFLSLPESIKATQCRVVYVCRNPFDNFISLWHFVRPATRSEDSKPLSLEEAFDMFCGGVSSYGPFWDHMLGFWNESLKNPQKILFLMYEDMKIDIKLQMKKLAEFLGLPFDEDEEKMKRNKGSLMKYQFSVALRI